MPSSASICRRASVPTCAQPLAALADHDALLAGPLDVDGGVHVEQVVAALVRDHLLTTTAIECGSSSRTPSSAASRTSSATRVSSGSSVSSPSG